MEINRLAKCQYLLYRLLSSQFMGEGVTDKDFKGDIGGINLLVSPIDIVIGIICFIIVTPLTSHII